MKANRIDKYEVLEQVGQGGMGAVYKALHPQFKKYVAIKEIRSDLSNSPEFRQRFEREIELLARLPPHPNIVPVRDALTWQGRLYVVMDYIDGGSLNDFIRQGGIDVGYGATLLDQILAGLEAIHRRNIIHHDLKAGNILIDREGTAYISDFGIAECTGAAAGAGRMATAKCVAPEMIDPNLGYGAAREQIDIYAAGMLAYEMLLGQNRFREVFREIYNGSPDTAAERWLNWHTDLSRVAPNLNDIDPAIPRPLAQVVEQMMAKDLRERYKDASEARRDLAAATLGAQDARSRRPGPPGDDATIPIERLRGAGGEPQRPAAPPPARPPQPPPVRREPPPVAPSPPAAPAESGGTTRRSPKWVMLAIVAAVVIAAFVIVIPLALVGSPGFLLVVEGAPPGSELYVDDIRRGFPQADGTIIAPGLEARSRRVRVMHDGYQPFETSVVGKDGGEERVIARLVSMANGLKNEIDYNGPMILIPKGEFIMGSDKHENEEKPAHNLTLPDYYIDKFEVTNRQYKAFCDAMNRSYPTNPRWAQRYLEGKDYFKDYPDSPVVGVEYVDAEAYAAWAGKRLPTEAEWEKAASWDPAANKKRIWPWGDNDEQGIAKIAGFPPPSRVGSFPRGVSAYGVHDMAGNVVEWVDAYFDPYPGNQTPVSEFGKRHRVVRGGHFISSSDDARTTRRIWGEPIFSDAQKAQRDWLIGIRCVVSADNPKLKEFLRSKSSVRQR